MQIESNLIWNDEFSILNTPEECFENLTDFPFKPHYVELTNPNGEERLRMHYVDEGPYDAPCTVLLMHDGLTWSYLYRKMIPVFVKEHLRVIALDYIGFGRSDKLADKTHYTLEQHIAWVHELVCTLELTNVVLICHGWGGAIGMGLVAKDVDRFLRVVAGNTPLHTCEPELADHLYCQNHASDDQNQCISANLLEWISISQRYPNFQASMGLVNILGQDLPKESLEAYDAPFPEERFKQGMRQFPVLTPVTRNDPNAAVNRHTFEVLSNFNRPFLTIFGDADLLTKGWQRIFQERIPGAKDQPHITLENAGYLWPEYCGEEVAQLIADWIHNRHNKQQAQSATKNSLSIVPTFIQNWVAIHKRPMVKRGEAGWVGLGETALTWEKIKERQDIRLYAGDIPFFRTHLDTHNHIHRWLTMAQAMKRVAARHNIRKLRVLQTANIFFKSTVIDHRVKELPQRWKNRYIAYKMNAEGFQTPLALIKPGMFRDRDIPLPGDGGIEDWVYLIKRLGATTQPHTFEICCHPALGDISSSSGGSRPSGRELELRILTSEKLKQAVADSGIQLIPYDDL